MTSVAKCDSHVADFLDMLAAERGASQNTIDAYTSDLDGFTSFLDERGVAAPEAVRERHSGLSRAVGQRGPGTDVALAATVGSQAVLPVPARRRLHRGRPDVRVAGAQEAARAAQGLEHRRSRPPAAVVGKALRGLGRPGSLSGAALSLPARNSLRDRHARVRACRPCRGPCCAATGVFSRSRARAAASGLCRSTPRRARRSIAFSKSQGASTIRRGSSLRNRRSVM